MQLDSIESAYFYEQNCFYFSSQSEIASKLILLGDFGTTQFKIVIYFFYIYFQQMKRRYSTDIFVDFF